MTALARFALVGLVLPVLMGAGPAARVVVKGQGTVLRETPIVVEVRLPIEPGSYVLFDSIGKSVVIGSVYRDGGKTYLACVLPQVPAAGDLDYSLVAFDEAVEHSFRADRIGPRFHALASALEVALGDQPFTTYQAPEGLKPYFFPLIGPTGNPFTRAYPMKDVPGEKHDHPHQKSLWFTHGNVNGIDFWAEAKGHGSIRETSRSLVTATPALGQLKTTDDWVAPDGKVVCTDERTVRLYRSIASGVRYLDFDITIKADHGPVTFGDTKEGMFGVRVASSMDVDAKKGGKITNSDGLNDAAAWGKPATWVDYTGPVEGETVGIAILNHPSSFRHPTTWHVRTYGLFAANPFGWHDFGLKKPGDHTIPAGESIHFGYRVILHKGDTASAALPAAYEAYAKPPTVEVLKGE
jgi:hypothetical protein